MLLILNLVPLEPTSNGVLLRKRNFDSIDFRLGNFIVVINIDLVFHEGVRLELKVGNDGLLVAGNSE